MIEGFTRLVRVQPGDFEMLVEKAKEDKHGVYVPTHIVKLGNETLGYFSIGSPGVPIVMAWLNTKEMKARESFHLINTVENIAQSGGAISVAFPVPKTSPFHPLMEPMGFTLAGNYDFFVKKLT